MGRAVFSVWLGLLPVERRLEAGPTPFLLTCGGFGGRSLPKR